jgi:hypothetical protein
MKIIVFVINRERDHLEDKDVGGWILLTMPRICHYYYIRKTGIAYISVLDYIFIYLYISACLT